jgi:uncharacterized repeat protein (TIGR02543 family)
MEFPANPSRSGYIFTGWNTQADGSGSDFTSSTTVSGNITVYALWTEGYAVTFMLNNGTGTVHTGRAVTPPADTIGAEAFPGNPSWNGYTFAGWNTAADGSGDGFTSSTTVSGNITVYAQWMTLLPGSYIVRFRLDDGTETVWAVKAIIPPATTVDALPVPPSRRGYNFGGWYTAQNGGGSEFTGPTMVMESIIVYAKWDSYSYTVRFNNNGGDITANPVTKTVNSPNINIGTLPVPPTRTDYNFVNWNTEADGSGTVFTASTTVNGDIEVYAQWAHTQFDIALNPDAGSGVFDDGDFTVSKGESGYPSKLTISITGSGYTDPRWIVDGTLKETGTNITIEAVDYGLGGHNLSLLIIKNGITWSKDIAFIVTN